MSFIPIEMLYWGGGKEQESENVYMHQHDFYQLEFCREGRRLCRGKESADVIINPGEAVFIPMGIMHSFMPYKSKYCTYFSYKFRITNAVELPNHISKIPGDFFMQWALQCMEELMPSGKHEMRHSTALISEEIAVLLTGMLNHLTHIHKDDFSSNDTLTYMRKVIYQFGAETSVKFLSDGLKITVPQFRYRYRKAINSLVPDLPRYNNPADFIASELMEIAKKHLQSTTFSVGEISHMMKFNNVYTFSRFFKQHEGVSPLQYRKKRKPF